MITTDLSPLVGVDRGELVVNTGTTYDGVTPVRVHVTKRDRRYEVSDGGGAVAAAGVGVGGLAFDGRIPIDDRYDVNVSRKGVVGIPIGPRNATPAWIEKVIELVAEGSRTLYQALLESD